MHGFMISYEASLLNELVCCDIWKKILGVSSILSNELKRVKRICSEGFWEVKIENFDGVLLN